MLYLRGQARDYDEWAQLTGDSGWAWQNVLPIFMRLEDHWRGADEKHGEGGEWRVESPKLRWEILESFAAAAAETGIPKVDDFNRGDNEGVGRFEVNQRNGVRWSASKAFLRPAMKRPNLTVVTGALVKKLRLEGRRVLGVEFSRGNEEKFAEARREAILCAGAIGSPQILQLSGIGPGALLQGLGVPVVHDLPAVGSNLQDHLQLRMAFKVKNALTLNTLLGSWWHKAAMGCQYAWSRSGAMTMPPSQMGAFVKSDASQRSANLEYHVQPISLDKFGDPPHRFNAFTASACNLRPTSRGTVRIASADPRAYPAIAPNYLSTEEDRQVAASAIRLTRRIVLDTDAMKRHEPEEYTPGAQFQSPEELVQAAGNIGTTIFHPVGTCRMGRDGDDLAVVDPAFRVRGIAGLRVIDASVMPTITSGNTNSPTLMIAERAAGLLTTRE
jgi:choline dehydrogenase